VNFGTYELTDAVVGEKPSSVVPTTATLFGSALSVFGMATGAIFLHGMVLHLGSLRNCGGVILLPRDIFLVKMIIRSMLGKNTRQSLKSPALAFFPTFFPIDSAFYHGIAYLQYLHNIHIICLQ
jgi:hypothetical protein